MPEVVIADTSCLIILGKIGRLGLLKELYGEVLVTPEIVHEYGKSLPEYFITREYQNRDRMELLELQLDRGEASAIALAKERKSSILILDDYKARVVAKSIGLRITGTLGVILKAKKEGVILSVGQVLEEIERTNFRLSPNLRERVLKLADEL